MSSERWNPASSHARSQFSRRPCCSGCNIQAHIIGVRMSETTPDIRIATLTVTANSRNSRPIRPPISSSGMNTAVSDRVIETMVKPISCEPIMRGLERPLALLDVAVDVLDHDDGVVDDEADRDGQRHQRHVVDGVAERGT